MEGRPPFSLQCALAHRVASRHLYAITRIFRLLRLSTDTLQIFKQKRSAGDHKCSTVRWLRCSQNNLKTGRCVSSGVFHVCNRHRRVAEHLYREALVEPQ